MTGTREVNGEVPATLWPNWPVCEHQRSEGNTVVVLMKLGWVQAMLATVTVGGEEVEHGDGEPEARRLVLELKDVIADMG